MALHFPPVLQWKPNQTNLFLKTLATMADPIIVVPYDPSWPVQFAALGKRLRQALGSVALRIDHIGSTSVPGLDAKPIIDVQISVTAFEPIGAYRVPLEKVGFLWRSNNLDLNKRYFREQPNMSRTHIHVRRAGSWGEQFSLLFRDYLRNHPDDARAYATLKYALAEKYRGQREAYTDAKGPFIWELMAKADEWYQRTGWLPGPSDA
jgi:GrpB-like predicted nucleotidyltransferase (UPF0157 family)